MLLDISSSMNFRHATVKKYLENNMYLVDFHGGEYSRVYGSGDWKDGDQVVIQNNQIVGQARGIDNPKTLRV